MAPSPCGIVRAALFLFPVIGFLSSSPDVVVMHGRASDEYSQTVNRRTENGRAVFCYYTNWAQYRPDQGRFVPEDIDVSLCTHLVYAFAKIDGGKLAPYEWNDDSTQWSKGMYERFNALKSKKPGLKTLLSVGGWNLGSDPFTQVVATPETRKTFIDHAIGYLRNRNFDGLDVDWEFPTQRGSPPEDRDRFTQLLQELRAAFQKEASSSGNDRLMLTAAVGASETVIEAAYDIPAITKVLDFVNLLSYDMHGSWEPYTGINSPLYALSTETGLNATLCQDWAVRYWLGKGVPNDKLNMGMAFYGRTFQLVYSAEHDIKAPASGPGLAGEITRTAGFLAYYEICTRLKQGWTSVFQSEQKANYAFKDFQWVGYDDVNSMKIKGAYVKKMGLSGVLVWTLPLDDFTGTFCGGGAYPMLHALVNSLE